MTLRILLILLVLMIPMSVRAGDDVNTLLERALKQLVTSGYVGDTSAAQRYLQAILEEQPEHLEAQWQLVYLGLVHLMDTNLSDRVTGLGTIAPTFERVAKLAERSKNKAFLHFITAIYASYYNNFDRALREIDRALALEPQSVRYLTAKARLIVGYGKWTKQDARIEQGISLLRQVREQSLATPTPFLYDHNFAYYLADATSKLTQPRWNEVAEYYRQFVEQSTEQSVAYAFALNNVSIAYRELGQCEEARQVAERALKVMKFGAAESNRRYAEFCLEMQKMGLIAKKETVAVSINTAP